MKEHVTVIPSDGIIICDGVALPCEFVPHLDHLHALQWHNGRGHIELKKDGIMSNREIVSYETDVQPYVERWQAHLDTLDAASGTTPEKTEASGASPSAAPADRSPLSGETARTTAEAVPATDSVRDPFAGKPLYRYGTTSPAAGTDGLAGTLSTGASSRPDKPSATVDGNTTPGQMTPPCIIASGSDATGWYRQWSDGWLEQGGQRTIAPRGSVEVGFPVVFGTVLHIGITPWYYTGERNRVATIGLASQSTSGFTAWQCSEKKGSCWNGFVWYACGESA